MKDESIESEEAKKILEILSHWKAEKYTKYERDGVFCIILVLYNEIF